ncbi:CDP-glycerol glycerophosphotransferase family protein [Galbitalea soli]|uniref:CDP-glycerol--glycerophosphate glycerophosphotransferase n=1 Tax=Galbitalea soli TaxID=1268042 RepID=A0A7C9TQA8_9MICO|nr:CDP-glycerol glycerophosphotransferase family protein [Galbitalea soli]NEM91336.1 CDP-glycerol--glycerophosphate glycerophosphotransferase [Galbitalea soli]NYJ30026.1 CDP-glycerol glycerophosphotransferase [Galbitalea soli]
MKIDRTNPRHWAYLASSGITVLAAGALRPLLRRAEGRSWAQRPGRRLAPEVVLYGHSYNGNLSAFVDHCRTAHPGALRFSFASLEDEPTELPPDVRPLVFRRLSSAARLARVAAVITDRDAPTLSLLARWSDIPFVDVWHGIPFKGFTPATFTGLRDYAEVWVSSPELARLYVERFGFRPEIVHPTGYARVDALATGRFDAAAIRQRLGIGADAGRIVLLAPTWKQDDAERSIIPFGVTADEFFDQLEALGRETDSLVVFRAHLHAGEAEEFASRPHVRVMSNRQYPNAEEFLAIADVLVTDWSSLAFDALPLRRPIVFLDVEPPFRDGFSLGPEHRVGAIVVSVPALVAAIRAALADPGAAVARVSDALARTLAVAYGDTLDGGAAERQYQRLRTLIDSGQSGPDSGNRGRRGDGRARRSLSAGRAR